MTQAAQKQRRNSIRDILADESLTPLEKRRGIQSLMDGRRRSSNATHSSEDGSRGEMFRSAREAAAFYTSDNEDETMQNGAAAAAAAEYGYSNGDNAVEAGPQHLRKGRSTSMPGWSDSGMQGQSVIANATNSGDGNSVWDDPINVSRRMEMARPPCNHYERNCTIVSPCCGLAFGCRICHDECPELPMPFAKRPGQDACIPVPPRVNWDSGDTPKRKQEKRPSLPLGFDEEETHHEIDRFAIAEIICRLCYTRQSSKRYVQ